MAAAFAGDQVATERVELVLPQTGMCSGGGLIEEAESAATTGGGCCGPADEVADSIPAAGIAW